MTAKLNRSALPLSAAKLDGADCPVLVADQGKLP
jgi:hypothetical protein